MCKHRRSSLDSIFYPHSLFLSLPGRSQQVRCVLCIAGWTRQLYIISNSFAQSFYHLWINLFLKMNIEIGTSYQRSAIEYFLTCLLEVVLRGKFSSQRTAAVNLFQDYLMCTMGVVENRCVDFWFCEMQLNINFQCPYAVLFVAFCCQMRLFFPFYISLELIHHIRMDIIAIYTFQGMHSFFTKRLQDEICFNIIKVQAPISL